MAVLKISKSVQDHKKQRMLIQLMFWLGDNARAWCDIITQAINFQNFKIHCMSSVEYYRLCLQQQTLYYQQLEDCLALTQQIEDLKAKITAKHKKHRRCDKEIEKEFQCSACEKRYASNIALKLHFKLKHPKQLEEKTCGCSTQESHYQPEQLSPEQHVEVVASK